jgi:hypothetical protein
VTSSHAISGLPSLSGNLAIDLVLVIIALIFAIKGLTHLFITAKSNSTQQVRGMMLRQTLELKANEVDALRSSLSAARDYKHSTPLNSELSDSSTRLNGLAPKPETIERPPAQVYDEREYDPRYAELEEQLAQAAQRERKN